MSPSGLNSGEMADEHQSVDGWFRQILPPTPRTRVMEISGRPAIEEKA
jgi:hypothetical protein